MYEFIEYQVADAMTFHPVTVRPDATLADAEALFERYDYDCLPVCDADGRLRGVVSKLDFLNAFAFTADTMVPRYAEIMERPVESIMTRQPTTVPQDMRLTRVLQMLVSTRHKSFPVTAGKMLLGMISRQDVVRALRRAAGGERTRVAEQMEE
jgi:CBS domain-containing protein